MAVSFAPTNVSFVTYCSLWEIVQSLYFAAFGLVEIRHFALRQDHVVTEFIGKLMFGVYSAITIIVLINMLIAMLSNSYQIIYVSTDVLYYVLLPCFLCVECYFFFSLWEILQSLYFAAFALIDVKHFELQEDHIFTEFIGKLMFGVYSAITIIVLINMLIAMLSNSYQIIAVSKFSLSLVPFVVLIYLVDSCALYRKNFECCFQCNIV